MLSFQEFFDACSGVWKSERTYHSMPSGEIERSFTKFHVHRLTDAEAQRLLTPSQTLGIDPQRIEAGSICPGFAIAFDTVSETGEQVAMSLKALFVPDPYVSQAVPGEALVLPVVSEVADGDVIQGFYLRDQGYSEAGAIAGRFTYQPTRQTLEMTTQYKRSVAVDQMRLISPDVRLRTIVTYNRPEPGYPPSDITLIGFGVERK
ncbi:phycobiliprotein lyase [Myxacorys almedinensis]|uniref:Chromophore lyase CpcS/CpeS n=1 Tax=Myxacorys almedinensis A TaxID=2690445 RepID=A0A8J8CJG2_9CYAN|nr:phycobiliprotein lyase [Myxacorys almedinensis]NDJ18634.1 phycobiliprotein lyase [Myxacorys almedinensis A]